MDYHADMRRAGVDLLVQAAPNIDWVKQAEAVDQSEDLSGLPATSFADPVRRQYPIHTKQACLLSAGYAALDGADGEVMVRLSKAATVWGIADQVKQAQTKIAAFQPTIQYVVDIELDGARHQHLPFADQAGFEKAASVFAEQRHRLPLEARIKVADSLLDRAARGYQLPECVKEYVVKVAAKLADPLTTDAMVLERAALAKDRPDLVAKLAQAVRLAVEEPEWHRVAVGCFEAFDRETGLDRQYGSKLAAPEEALYQVPKQASDEVVRLQTGQTVRVGDIDWSKVAQVDPALAAEVGGSPRRAVEILPTWPRSDIEVLAQMGCLG